MGRAYQNRKDSMAKTSDMKARVYSRYARELYVSAKSGGADPTSNLSLRGLIERAKKNQVPAHVIEKALDKLVLDRKYHFVCLMITDITRQNSLLMVGGNKDFIEAVDYPPREERLFEMGNVVSRKKQLLPHIINILTSLEEPKAGH